MRSADVARVDDDTLAAVTAAWVPYERDLVEELYQNDALLVMARGLGVQRLLAYFLRLYSSPQTLVLCLNANEQVAQFQQLVLSLGLDRKHLPTVIDAKSSVSERMQRYKRGGCFFVTSRILVVDLLNNKMDGKLITGVLVNDAHRVTETSIEAFIIRLFREVNREGFIKAFSDDTASLAGGFNKMEQVLKHLYLRQVVLYPRFHSHVQEFLESRQPNVYEIQVAFSPRMRVMQEALLVALEATMKELQRSTNALDASELTMERALSKSFSNSIRRQLDPVWHKLHPKSKQLVGDLTTLRQLLSYLPRYDAISYYSFLVNYQVMNGQQRFPSAWLFTEAADRLVTAAKERLYQIVDKKTKKPIKRTGRSRGTYSTSAVGEPSSAKHAELQYVLEGNPKWDALVQILDEVNTERAEQETKHDTSTNANNIQRDGAQVLIMVKDERTCAQLREFLALGEREMMRRRFGHYLLQRDAATRKKGGARASLSVEQQLLIDAASQFRASEQAFRTQHDVTVTSGSNTTTSSKRVHKQKQNGNKRGIDESAAIDTFRGDVASFGMSIEELEAVAALEDILAQNKRRLVSNNEASTTARTCTPSHKTSVLSIERIEPCDQIVLCTYDQAQQHGHGTGALLQDVTPSCVILYDPDMAFIRELEIFHATQPQGTTRSLEIYFMMYEESAEQQAYLSEVHREKRSFESLIHQRAHLMMPANVYDVPYHVKAQRLQTPQYSMDTRTGGGARGRSQLHRPGVKVIVDVREFRSALPSMLHKEGLLVQPVTLEVGDYILSPQICVERKSISDLFGSLNSGRLFNQAEQMGRFYELPALLIEFSQGKAFSLQDAGDLGSEISASNIVSKLTLLILHFPKLRILWSRSPHATVDLVRVIKKNQPEPDLDVAQAMGTGNAPRGSSTVAGNDDADQEADGIDPSEQSSISRSTAATPSSYYNTNAMDVLRKLPGINEFNYRKVLARVNSLAELSLLSRAELTELLGKTCGSKLYTFFHAGI